MEHKLKLFGTKYGFDSGFQRNDNILKLSLGIIG